MFPVLLLHLWLLLPRLDLKVETKCVDPSSLALRPCLSLSGQDRVTRAWTCGQWAAAVRAARIGSLDRTPPTDFKNRFYAVLKARGLEKAIFFLSGTLDLHSVPQKFRLNFTVLPKRGGGQDLLVGCRERLRFSLPIV